MPWCLYYLTWIFDMLGVFFSLTMSRWNGDKWIFLSNIYLVSMLLLFFFIIPILLASPTLLIKIMLGFLLLMLFTCVLTFFPNL